MRLAILYVVVVYLLSKETAPLNCRLARERLQNCAVGESPACLPDDDDETLAKLVHTHGLEGETDLSRGSA